MSQSLEGLTVDQVYGFANLTNTLVNSPETREQFLNLVKIANPGLVVPEIDAKNQVLAELNQERKARLALEARIQEREIREGIERKKTEVQSKFGFSSGDMAEVEKVMLDEQIPNYETAAKYLKASRQVAEKSYNHTSGSPQVTMPDASVWKRGFGDGSALKQIALDEAYKAFSEIGSN